MRLPITCARLILVAFAWCCATTLANADQISGLFNTGVNDSGALLPQGSADPHYTLISVPPGSGYGPTAFVTVADGYPIPPWLPQGPSSQWIQPLSPTADSHAIGDYTYRTTFDLTGLNPSTAVITGQWISDNSAKIFLNGLPTGISRTEPFPLDLFESFTIASGFVEGVNTLDFLVNNSLLPTGLRVELRGTADPRGVSAVPEPTSIALLGLACLVLAVYRSRRLLLGRAGC